MSNLQICLTHDIDRISKSWQYITHDLRKGRISGFRPFLKGNNPYWMFEKMMGIEEKYGVRSTTFFLEETMPATWSKPTTWKLAYGRYSYQNKEIQKVIRDMDAGGWEIGVHGSYLSYKNLELLKQEKDHLEQILGHSVSGIRQHYLNMEEPLTWELHKKAGFEYDASLGRTDGIGYKDDRIAPFTHKKSGLFVIPLTLMECYLFSEAGHNPQKALKLAIKWMDHSEKHEVPFTILWHQRMFNEEEFPGYAWVYEEIIKEGKKRGAEFLTCDEIVNKLNSEEKISCH
ncbi:hypothetical protein DYD21_10490 [Rhodohalobacter sp. SW132]|uniref:polysaccharide deacetylase family protein n=1 Tax=Rhodohalobacter sp. SW132 TaxID=2293433 RepID=UPI000E266D82|nr:polysaccharide deacetylase family protein [Rhodohalobacter sp. SW132]REL33824.1 hypothetical protein DYD21_10490 [Rhodohalobacter sp. SW132]